MLTDNVPACCCSRYRAVAKMNDPGLDEPIQEHSKDVEQDRKNELEVQREDEQAFLDPR